MNMTHDPMQPYATSGYPGVTPFGLPYGALQTPGIQVPYANPLAQIMGISPAYSGYATHSVQPGITGGQNPLLTAGAQHPLLYAVLQNPILQNALLQNPVLQHQLLQNPFVNPIQAQLQAHAQQLALQAYAAQLGGAAPFGGQSSPYGQIGVQLGQSGQPWTQAISPLAPQTWVGQGAGIGYGQGPSIQPHALAQLVGRGLPTPGISPWIGF
jgi:hypothetical protein